MPGPGQGSPLQGSSPCPWPSLPLPPDSLPRILVPWRCPPWSSLVPAAFGVSAAPGGTCGKKQVVSVPTSLVPRCGLSLGGEERPTSTWYKEEKLPESWWGRPAPTSPPPWEDPGIQAHRHSDTQNQPQTQSHCEVQGAAAQSHMGVRAYTPCREM